MLASLLIAGSLYSPVNPDSLDDLIQKGMAQTQTQGLAVALIDGGKVKDVRTYGIRNAKRDPLQRETVMYGASITKAVFAYAVMGLVRENKLDLDKPLCQYLPNPIESYISEDTKRAYTNLEGLADQPSWKKITARHALTHSTGFANFYFLEPDGKLHLHFEPGTRYAYSGDGLMLLQFVLEQGLKLNMNEEIKTRVFTPFKMTRTSLTWNPEFEHNYADGFRLDGTIQEHSKRKRVRLAGSMDTTIEDMAKFAAGVLSQKRALAQMATPQLPITSSSQFPTLFPHPAQRPFPNLDAGLGGVTFKGPQGVGFYKGGHDDGTANTWVTLQKKNRAIVILSNDVRAEALFPAITKAFLKDSGLPWQWEYPDLKFYSPN